jgi:hypothetical protein
MKNEMFKFPKLPTHHSHGINDHLDYKSYADAMYEQICKLRPENNGITFGIMGEWGMGKSSVLNMLARKLKSNKSFITIRFDAWQYLRQEDLWLAFFRKVMRELLSTGWYRVKYWRKRVVTNPKRWNVFASYTIKSLAIFSLVTLFYLLWVLLQTTGWTALIKDTELNLGIIKVSLKFIDENLLTALLLIPLMFYYLKLLFFGNLQTNFLPLTKKEFDQDQSILIDDFKDDFNAVLESLGKQKTVVILIDDLDRCPPSQIVPVLEAIKHLGSDGEENESAKTVFILAVDPSAIEHALSGYFKDYFQGNNKDEEAHRFSKNYIEKIIQVSSFLPPITESQLDYMLEKLLFEEGNDP